LCDAGSSGLQRKISGCEQSIKSDVALKESQYIAIDSEPDDCETYAEKSVWLKMCRIQLSEADRMTLITFGCQLNDKHITLALKLLQNQFPNVEGFAPTLMQTKKGQNTSGIQIIFCHGNHWIAINNVGDIIIYDSLHFSINEEVKEIVLSLFSYKSLSMAPMQKLELESNNCGVFAAAAVAFSFAPSQVKFKETEMCRHLFQCFENGFMTPFPCHNIESLHHIS